MGGEQEPLRLLLVEDADDDAELLLRELRRSGFEVASHRVQTASTLELALAEEWDIVICDYGMPELDVQSVLASVRAKWSDLPFIVVSGSVGEEAVVKLMRAGANDYLLKGSLTRLGPAVAREVREGRAGAERRRAERRRAQAEESFRRIIEASPDLILVHRDDRVVYANPNTLQRLGCKDASALDGALLSAIVLEPDARAQRPDTAPVSGRPAPLEQRWRCADGSTIAVEVVHCDVVFQGAVGTAVIARDLTERHHFASAMVEMDRMAAIGTLAAGVGHEINNPLAYVLANLEFVEGEIDDLVAEIPADARRRLEPRLAELRQALADTSQGAHRVRTIIADLRTFSRGDETSILIDVRKVLDASARMAGVQIRQRATVVKTYADEVSPVLASDSRLGQVFLNLVVNAAQALPEGAPAEQNRIELDVRDEGEFVRIDVADTGCGIPADILPRIFEPFFTTKPSGQGTGLGLGICRRIVHQLGGEISVTSEVGTGTRFVVRLPQARPSQPPAS
jgi:PAS domain S-box-containing protein